MQGARESSGIIFVRIRTKVKMGFPHTNESQDGDTEHPHEHTTHEQMVHAHRRTLHNRDTLVAFTIAAVVVVLLAGLLSAYSIIIVNAKHPKIS